MRMKGSIQIVVFDFDYTLADSSTGVVHSANHALETLGLPPADEERIKRTIGLPLIVAFAGIVAGGIILVGYLFNLVY